MAKEIQTYWVLRIFQSNSAANAKGYYVSGLEDAHEYYANGANQSGIWFGKAAKRLGLEGEVTQEQFFQLCDNRRPDTGEKINPRENKIRKVGYDITFSAPKSVSLAQAILGDDRIIEAFQSVVLETMKYIETEIHVRVRKNGANDVRKTGNMAGGLFTHFESRPLEGLSDPQLHCHAYGFNTTYDPVEGIFKALELFFIKRDAPYYQAIFHSRLAQHMQAIGYVIENKPFSFEIAGFGEENLKRFSRRTAEIEQLALELGIDGNSKAMDQLGAKCRQSKGCALKGEAKIKEWKNRIDWSQVTINSAVASDVRLSAAEAVGLAISNMLERQSVVPLKRLAANALQISLGDCVLEEIINEIRSRQDLVVSEVDGTYYATTEEIISEEKAILTALESAKGKHFPFNLHYQCSNDLLDGDQRGAIEAIMHSFDQAIVIQGRAGTGKTSMAKTAVSAINTCGFEVYTFAPTSQAVQVLKMEGFGKSDTIQQLLVNRELQSKLRNNVMWIDEAGLVSVAEMRQLLQIAQDQNARVVFSGDTTQHNSVDRGDALRLICESGHVTVKITRNIYRQRKDAYKSAVDLLSNGDVAGGLAVLDQIGAIRNIPEHQDRIEEMAHEYVGSLEKSDSVLAIAPTHFEGALLTQEIRSLMWQKDLFGTESIEIPVYRSRNLTEAERSLPHFYERDSIIRFHRKAGVFARNEIVRVSGKQDSQILVKHIGQSDAVPLDLKLAENFNVFREAKIQIAVGDRLRLNRNARDLDGRQLYNGNVHTVTKLLAENEIKLDGEYRLSAAGGFLDYGYVSTSHSSQGRTASKVILSQSSLSLGAADLKQFYVSVSRGRDEIVIFTDSREDLFDQVSDPHERMLAIELERIQDLRLRRHKQAIYQQAYGELVV